MHPTRTHIQVCIHVHVESVGHQVAILNIFSLHQIHQHDNIYGNRSPQPNPPRHFKARVRCRPVYGASCPSEYCVLLRENNKDAQQQRHASTVSMAQATSPSMSLQDGHQNNHHNTPHVKSNPDVPIDPSIAASSPTYPPYSPYTQQGHEMSQYQGHPPPGYQHWPQQYTGHPHGIPNGPYSSPGTAVSAAGAAATAGPRPGQVCLRAAMCDR